MNNNSQGANAIERINNAINKMDGAYYFCGKKLGIKENTLTLFYALKDGAPHTQKQICEEWLIPKTTINTTVKELLQEGLIALLPIEHSKEKTIRLTANGQQYVRHTLKDINQAEEQALHQTVQKFSPQFIEALEFFANNLCEEFARRNLK